LNGAVTVGSNAAVPYGKFYTFAQATSGPAAIQQTAVFEQSLNATPSTGFGGSLVFRNRSSTTIGQLGAELQWLWANATDASRTGRLTLGAHDSATALGAPREGLRVEATGAAAALSFFGAAAVVQQANASQAAINAITDANAKAVCQALYNLLKNYGLAPATA
jgi:hypothetical protein